MQSKVLLANQIAGLSNQPYLEQNDEIVRFFAFCYKFMEIKSYLEIILDHGALKFCCMSRMNWWIELIFLQADISSGKLKDT